MVSSHLTLTGHWTSDAAQCECGDGSLTESESDAVQLDPNAGNISSNSRKLRQKRPAELLRPYRIVNVA